MSDIGVEFRAPILIADRAVFLQTSSAVVAVTAAEVVLRAAMGAVRRQFATGHRHKRTTGSFDDLQIANHEAIIDGDRAEGLQSIVGVFHQLDANLGDFHAVLLPMRSRSRGRPRYRKGRGHGDVTKPFAPQASRHTSCMAGMSANAVVTSSAPAHLVPQTIEAVKHAS